MPRVLSANLWNVAAGCNYGNISFLGSVDVPTSNPVIVSGRFGFSSTKAFAIYDDFVDSDHRYHYPKCAMFGISSPSSPTYIGSITLAYQGHTTNFGRSFGSAVVVGSTLITSIDLSEGSEITSLLQSWDLTGSPIVGETSSGLSLYEARLCPYSADSGDFVVTSDVGNLVLFDISDLSLASSTPTSSSCYDLTVVDNIAYLAEYEGETISAWNLNNPAAPALIGTGPASGHSIMWIDVYGSMAVGVSDDGTAVVWDVTDPYNILKKGSISNGNGNVTARPNCFYIDDAYYNDSILGTKACDLNSLSPGGSALAWGYRDYYVIKISQKGSVLYGWGTDSSLYPSNARPQLRTYQTD